jgi:hypothetical protein
MKIRQGFVSNSSSSSFVIYDARNGYDFPNFDSHLVVDSNFGETEFGWGPDKLYDFGSMVIFAYLQYLYAQNEDWKKMIEEVIQENTNVKTIDWQIQREDWDKPGWGYIDHQSSVVEGENTEIFDSKEILKDFFFGKGSYIVVDNDNH